MHLNILPTWMYMYPLCLVLKMIGRGYEILYDSRTGVCHPMGFEWKRASDALELQDNCVSFDGFQMEEGKG